MRPEVVSVSVLYVIVIGLLLRNVAQWRRDRRDQREEQARRHLDRLLRREQDL